MLTQAVAGADNNTRPHPHSAARIRLIRSASSTCTPDAKQSMPACIMQMLRPHGKCHMCFRGAKDSGSYQEQHGFLVVSGAVVALTQGNDKRREHSAKGLQVHASVERQGLQDTNVASTSPATGAPRCTMLALALTPARGVKPKRLPCHTSIATPPPAQTTSEARNDPQFSSLHQQPRQNAVTTWQKRASVPRVLFSSSHTNDGREQAAADEAFRCEPSALLK